MMIGTNWLSWGVDMPMTVLHLTFPSLRPHGPSAGHSIITHVSTPSSQSLLLTTDRAEPLLYLPSSGMPPQPNEHGVQPRADREAPESGNSEPIVDLVQAGRRDPHPPKRGRRYGTGQHPNWARFGLVLHRSRSSRMMHRPEVLESFQL